MRDRDCFVRNPAATVLTFKKEIVCIVGRDRVSFRLPGSNGALHRIIELLRTPATLAEVCAETGSDEHVTDRILDVLLAKKVIVITSGQTDPVAAPGPKYFCAHVVVGISGSIYAAQVLPLAERIRETIAPQVEIILTEGAQRFVKPELFTYYGFPCWTDAYATRRKPKDEWSPSALHMQLATAADLVVVVPASARTVHKLASGECSDLLSLVVSATRAPVVVAPSMNEQMWLYPPIADNVRRLREIGMFCVEPARSSSVGSQSERRPFAGAGLNERNITLTLAAVLERSMRADRSSQRIANVSTEQCEVNHEPV